jgi:hypothetical protein
MTARSRRLTGYTRLTSGEANSSTNRITHLRLLWKGPFGPAGLTAGFPLDSFCCLAVSGARAAVTISMRVNG